ncbi:unnamed protein product [Thelazia callipaeda]|uniref:WW domain-binding protein 11 n=1 Tax=Thelazia callipaeda TaxID=103827 RepID=A0A0N5CSA4_THECL|nr:unnamed protein product [Thelazia callipaeda]
MGRRPGSTTKSGRFMNPADQERKSMRQKELKRNRKQRTLVRHAILKSKDVDEILENLSRLDDQEFDIHVEHHSKYVFNEKRIKFRQTFFEVVNLYKMEKRDDKVRELEQKMAHYEADRARKMQQYNALRFSLEGNPVEIPLPDGSSVPDAAMTPAIPSIPSQFLMPQARAGILKKSNSNRDLNCKAEPPGPPCGMPPPFCQDDDDVDEPPSKRRVRFEDDVTSNVIETPDDDLGPVEIPMELLDQNQTNDVEISRSVSLLTSTTSQQPLLCAPPLPPSLLPPPPRLPLRVPPPPPQFPSGVQVSTYVRPSTTSSVISADPMVRRAEAGKNGEATISAAPKLRDLTKEVTKFIPTALQVNRSKQQVKRKISKFNIMGIQVESAQRKEAKDTDEAYAEFMSEISSLL